MRKIYFIVVLLSLAIACRAEDNIQLELYGDSQKNGGARVISPLLEFRTANHPDKENFGLSLSSRNYFKKLPFELKYGNLSASGSLSRLNSPELSGGTSPFSSGIISVTGLSAALPGYTSFSKPESAFVQLSLNQLTKTPLSLSFNLWSSPENDSTLFSTLISDKFFSKQLTLSASFTAGEFFYEDNSSSSWFLESPYYSAGSHFCSLYQLGADYKNKSGRFGLYSALMAALYGSPFGPYSAVYRGDVKLSLKQAEFYTSAFLNAYEDLLTSSDKKLEPSLQVKSGALVKKPFVFNKSQLIFLKTGANVYSKINLTKAEHPLRVNGGLQFSSELTSLSLSLSGEFLLRSSSPEKAPEEIRKEAVIFQIKNSCYLKSLTPSLSFTSEISEKNKYKIQAGLTNNARHKISGNCAFSFSESGGDISDKKLTASLTCRLNFKSLRIIGKLSASTGF